MLTGVQSRYGLGICLLVLGSLYPASSASGQFEYGCGLLPWLPGCTPPAPQQQVDPTSLFGLEDGRYATLGVQGVAGASRLTLTDVVVADSVITQVGGGTLEYAGPMAELIGRVFTIKAGSSNGATLRLTVNFRVPQMLGGMSAEMQFVIADGRIAPVGLRIDIPGTIKREAFTIEKAYLEILPEQGKVGGGGLFAFEPMEKTFGGWIDFRAGIGPEIAGQRVDVTKFGAGAGSLGIPIGTTGAYLQYLSGIVENSAGLSDPENWGHSTFTGEYEITLGPSFKLGPKTVDAYVISGQGNWSVHSGAFDLTGTGKLFDVIQTTSLRAHYAPPFDISAEGNFDAGIYTGSIKLHQANSSFTGSLKGHLGIPKNIPVVGGFSLADVGATLNNLAFHGTASVQITPAIPEVCIPAVCGNVPPCFSTWGCWDLCRDCVLGVCGPRIRPCDCYTKEICGPRVCTPEVCTPAVPAVKASFGFTFDASSGHFDFSVSKPVGDGSELPLDAPGFTFLTNWQPLAPSAADSAQAIPAAASAQVFTLDRAAPGVIFRAAYTNAQAPEVFMKVVTPGGMTLASQDGALPAGFPNHYGYSRFNPDALEQVIMLVDPVPGDYQVTVENADALGEVSIQALVQDAPPLCGPVSVAPGATEGQYLVTWAHPTSGAVGIYLDPERGGHDGFLVATIEAAANTGSAVIDTTALAVPDGHYFVALTAEDGVNPPQHCASDQVILVEPQGGPEPVSGIQYLADDGRVVIRWLPSPTTDVVGYLVQYTHDHEDIGSFDAEVFVPAEGQSELTAEISGLTNGMALLVRVLAVGADMHRSAPSEMVRVTPHVDGVPSVPEITSTPDGDATVGYAYLYVPSFSDFDPAESYGWTLELAPVGMSIDVASGLIQWTPSADQVGYHDVIVRLSEVGGEMQVATVQAFRLHVYPADYAHGLEQHAYFWLSHPNHDARAGTTYGYEPHIWGPDSNFYYELLTGPEGMWVDPATGQLSWEVPADAKSAWVRLRALVGGKHSLEQDFYLFVENSDHAYVAEAAGGATGQPPAGPLCGLGVMPAMLLSLAVFAWWGGRARR